MAGEINFGNSDESAKQAEYLKTLDKVKFYLGKIMERLELEPGMRVMDLGCGLGQMTRRFAEIVGPRGRAVGIDHDARFIKKALEARAGVDKEILPFYTLGSVYETERPDNSFDRAFAERVLSHTTDPEAAVAEAFRILKPGGKLVLFDTDVSSLKIVHEDQEFTDKLMAAFTQAFKSGEVGAQLGDIMRTVGFEDVESTLIVDRHSFQSSEAKHYGTLKRLVKKGFEVDGEPLTREKLDRWWQHLIDQNEKGKFSATINLYLASGVKPLRA